MQVKKYAKIVNKNKKYAKSTLRKQKYILN